MNTTDTQSLFKIMNNAFMIRGAYHGLVERFGFTHPLETLANSQHRQTTDLLQLLWSRGVTPPIGMHRYDFRSGLGWTSALGQCIELEKEKLQRCCVFIAESNDRTAKEIVSEIKAIGKHIHLRLLDNYAQSETPEYNVKWISAVSPNSRSQVTLDRKEYCVLRDALPGTAFA